MTTLLTTTATTNSNSTSTNTTTEKDSLTPRTTFSHTHSHNGNINHISPTYSKSLPEFARCVSFNNINPPAYDSDSPLNSQFMVPMITQQQMVIILFCIFKFPSCFLR